MSEKAKKRGKIRHSLAWAFKPLVNVKGWMGYQEVKQGYQTLAHAFSDLLQVTPTDRRETFDEAVIRLNLNELKLKQQAKNFFRMLVVCLLIFIFMLTLSLYWLFTGGFFGGVVTLLFSFVALANAIRYHFWIYQINKRKLGCSLQQWFIETFIKRRC